jgi:DNA polymerase IV
MTDKAGFCRDCFASVGQARSARCFACGSPRLVVHPELSQLAIAHLDCDAFYAAVEKRDDPTLRDKPLIVGGGKRGVVSTCCYVARTYGVRSAMPMFKALALCPQAIVLRPNMTKYAAVGHEIRKLMTALTPLVEPMSIDEAFLDLSGTELLHGMSPAVTLARFAKRVEIEIGITASIGLSYCKFLAKIASDLDKPRGFKLIGRNEAKTFLAAKPVGLIWGVGKIAQDRLARDGFRLIGDLQAREERDLLRLYGQEGQRLWRLAQGQDNRRVEPEHSAKSISSETTFESDFSQADDLVPILYRLSERVAGRLKHAELASRSVTLKLKTTDFKIRTRSRSGLPATQLSGRLFAAARDLLLPELDGAKFRLIGLAANDLCPAAEADLGDLVDSGVVREKAAETAIDSLRAKFGPSAVVKGITLRDKRRH